VGKPIYDTIGTGYNSTRQADPFLASRLYELLQAQKEKRYLDVGCGTGNYTIALTNKGLRFCGVEPSEKMLQVARSRDERIDWYSGSAEKIPAQDSAFAGAIATLTIHHWTDLNAAFREISRVLEPNARLVIFTSLPEQTSSYWLSHYFPKTLVVSAEVLPSYERIHSAAALAGFEIVVKENYFVRDDLQDHFFYVGKNRPELYFDETIRRGISSFSAFAHGEEVARGLAELKADVESGAWKKVREQYENDRGDYLFIVAQKKA
jgi:ubiquinone/menaquinone biosynthesis C-methylase UbiE